jgi:hypothetical protein
MVHQAGLRESGTFFELDFGATINQGFIPTAFAGAASQCVMRVFCICVCCIVYVNVKCFASELARPKETQSDFHVQGKAFWESLI